MTVNKEDAVGRSLWVERCNPFSLNGCWYVLLESERMSIWNESTLRRQQQELPPSGREGWGRAPTSPDVQVKPCWPADPKASHCLVGCESGSCLLVLFRCLAFLLSPEPIPALGPRPFLPRFPISPTAVSRLLHGGLSYVHLNDGCLGAPFLDFFLPLSCTHSPGELLI